MKEAKIIGGRVLSLAFWVAWMAFAFWLLMLFCGWMTLVDAGKNMVYWRFIELSHTMLYVWAGVWTSIYLIQGRKPWNWRAISD